MSNDTNPVSERAGQANAPESPVTRDLRDDRAAEHVHEQNEGENSSEAPYMSHPERARPERAPESSAEARSGAADAENIQPAKPPEAENNAGGTDLAPRAHRNGDQPDGDEPQGQRI